MSRCLFLPLAACLCFSDLRAVESTIEALLQAAAAAESRGAPVEALVVLEQADALRPHDPGILQKLARQCSDHSEDVPDRQEKIRWCNRALDYARRAVESQPAEAENVLSLAIVYGKLARLADTRAQIEYARLAHEYATRALALDPAYDYAHHVLGRWHSEVASIPAAQRWLVRLVYGGLPPASMKEAVQHLRQAVKLAPVVPAHHAALGMALEADHQLESARACYQRACALPPHDHYDRLMQRRARAALARLSDQAGPTRRTIRDLVQFHTQRPPPCPWARAGRRFREQDSTSRPLVADVTTP